MSGNGLGGWNVDHTGPQVTPVTLERADLVPTADQSLWHVIRNSAESLAFDKYVDFIEPIMGRDPRAMNDAVARAMARRRLPFPDVEPYRLLKVATEVFLMANAGVASGTDDPDDVAAELDNLTFGNVESGPQ